MQLEEKVEAVEQVFKKLDDEISTFQTWSALHCKFGCGKCCFKPDIEASILEFLPFALHLYNNNQALEWLDKLKKSDSSVCLILNPTTEAAGLCSEYIHRGLICRLFGYSARTNKYNQSELITCQTIKSEQKDQFDNAVREISAGRKIPIMSQYYMQLQALDFDLTREFFPINVAISKAIETVLHYYAYRDL